LVLVNTCSIRDKAEQTNKTFRKIQCGKTLIQDESGCFGLYGRTFERQILEEEK
jgi:tRNA A37 methylthiotransferase MiaB